MNSSTKSIAMFRLVSSPHAMSCHAINAILQVPSAALAGTRIAHALFFPSHTVPYRNASPFLSPHALVPSTQRKKPKVSQTPVITPAMHLLSPSLALSIFLLPRSLYAHFVRYARELEPTRGGYPLSAPPATAPARATVGPQVHLRRTSQRATGRCKTGRCTILPGGGGP